MGTYGVVVAPTYPMLRDATQRTFFEWFRPYVRDHNKSDNVTLLKTGTVIYWRSADQPDRLRGPNLNWFYLDEADYMHRDTWDIALGRIRRHPSKAWLTTTPDGLSGKGWVKEKIWKPSLSDKSYLVVTAKTADNFHLPPEYIDALKASYASDFARQELDGEFVDAIGRVMRKDWIQISAMPPEDTQYTVGVDLAISMKKDSDDRAIVVVGKSDKTFYVVDVITGKWSFHETKRKIIEAADRWNAVKVCVENVAYQDAMVQELRSETMHNVQGVSPRGRDKLTRFLPVAGKYEHGFIRHVNNLCAEFTEQLLIFDGSGKDHDDMVDALVYAITGHEVRSFVYDI
jgi:predicted phage terminase large subunit-like protein